MPPYQLSGDLLQATFATLTEPPPGASPAWREARNTRLIQEIPASKPADAGQARIAARILIVRDLADTVTTEIHTPGVTMQQMSGVTRTTAGLLRTAVSLDRSPRQHQQKPMPFPDVAVEEPVDLPAVDAAWRRKAVQPDAPPNPSPAHQPTHAAPQAPRDTATQPEPPTDQPAAAASSADAATTPQRTIAKLDEGPGRTRMQPARQPGPPGAKTAPEMPAAPSRPSGLDPAAMPNSRCHPHGGKCITAHLKRPRQQPPASPPIGCLHPPATTLCAQSTGDRPRTPTNCGYRYTRRHCHVCKSPNQPRATPANPPPPAACPTPASQPPTAKSLPAFTCVHPRQNCLALGDNAASPALHRRINRAQPAREPPAPPLGIGMRPLRRNPYAQSANRSPHRRHAPSALQLGRRGQEARAEAVSLAPWCHAAPLRHAIALTQAAKRAAPVTQRAAADARCATRVVMRTARAPAVPGQPPAATPCAQRAASALPPPGQHSPAHRLWCGPRHRTSAGASAVPGNAKSPRAKSACASSSTDNLWRRQRPAKRSRLDLPVLIP